MLDTNIIVYLARGGAAGRWIDQPYQLGTRSERPLCSIVSVGESLGIAAKRGWGSEKGHRLLTAMRNLVIVQLGQENIVERYGAIASFLEASGQRIQQNDMWIAASASETASVLLTTDRDFERPLPAAVRCDNRSKFLADRPAWSCWPPGWEDLAQRLRHPPA